MKHFSLNEFIASDTAKMLNIDNTPDENAINNLYRLITNTLEPARTMLQRPIYINSGYRCHSLNQAVGGVANSYHLQGRAADLTTGAIKHNRQLFNILASLPHTELIWEHGGQWIHVAL